MGLECRIRLQDWTVGMGSRNGFPTFKQHELNRGIELCKQYTVLPANSDFKSISFQCLTIHNYKMLIKKTILLEF